MNAPETIQAAIDKLEALKAESTRAPWHYETDDLTDDVSIWHDQEQRTHIAMVGQQEETRVYADADLIVTLHRTIDAQLKALEAAKWLLGQSRFPLNYTHAATASIIDLARAIVGEDE